MIILIAERIESCVWKYKKQRVQRLHRPIYLNMNIYIILNLLFCNVLFHAMRLVNILAIVFAFNLYSVGKKSTTQQMLLLTYSYSSAFQALLWPKNVKLKHIFMLAIYVGNKWRTIYGQFLVSEAIYRHV